ncbi:hypothetical protein HZU77_014060 [Neisseriaceae bacterium TC5R-5]|nr:hypothetical protein [Neisseriaceae bacterium TC5R-5]
MLAQCLRLELHRVSQVLVEIRFLAGITTSIDSYTPIEEESMDSLIKYLQRIYDLAEPVSYVPVTTAEGCNVEKYCDALNLVSVVLIRICYLVDKKNVFTDIRNTNQLQNIEEFTNSLKQIHDLADSVHNTLRIIADDAINLEWLMKSEIERASKIFLDNNWPIDIKIR